MRILFIHGRAQGGKDSDELKRIWLQTLEAGLSAAGESLPPGVEFDFPYYGDKLDAFAAAADLPTPDDVIAKGTGKDPAFEAFMQSALTEIYEGADLPESEVEAEMGDDADVREKGPQNWRWVRAIARTVDRRFARGSSWTIERFLRDVYLYVNSPGVTRGINAVVEEKLTDEPTVVVGHSLGSVVGYWVIQNNLPALHLCRYVTIGSPLGMRAIASRMGVPDNPAEHGWFNGYDPADIVALNPLDQRHFPTDPAIDNHGGVVNGTDNRHGIVGYLNDAKVAAAIVEGLRRCRP